MRYIDETLTDTTTPGQSRSESNGNEEVLNIPQTPSDAVLCHPQDTRYLLGFSPLRDTVSLFYSCSRLGRNEDKVDL